MKKTTGLVGLVIAALTLSSPQTAAAAYNFFKHKNGFYGGAEVGILNIDTDRDAIFDDFITGTDVDFAKVPESIDTFVSDNSLTNPGLVIDSVTIDKNNFKAGEDLDLNSYLSTLSSSGDVTTTVASMLDDLATDTVMQIALLEKLDDRIYAIRFFGGYNFKSFFGVEVGGFLTTDIATANQSTTFSFVTTGDKPLLSSSFTLSSISNLYGLEALGKLRLPLHPFFAYIKAGVAVVQDLNETSLVVTGVTRTESTENGSSDEDVEIYNERISSSTTEIRPVIGAGVALRAGESTVINLSYHRYAESGKQLAMNMIMLSFTFEFGSDKCGDALC